MHPDNLQWRDDDDHKEHHDTFHNKLPHEQIAQIVAQSRTILRSEFVNLIRDLLIVDPVGIYQPQAFKTQGRMHKECRKTEHEIRSLLSDD
jgi:hypothetical protein